MSILGLLLQVDTTMAAAAAGEQVSEMTLSFWELALKGGWIMLPIVFLSIIAIYIFIERYMAIMAAQKFDGSFMENIKDKIHEGKIDSALTLCKSQENPVARMIEKGISQIGRPLNDINASIENIGKLEIYKLEKGLPTLATTAGAAPMIGFLGTVIGMIQAFYKMSMHGNNVQISELSGGIYQAMVTTVAGLAVGIVAYFAYNILVAKIEKVVFNLEASTTEFMDLLNEPSK